MIQLTEKEYETLVIKAYAAVKCAYEEGFNDGKANALNHAESDDCWRRSDTKEAADTFPVDFGIDK